MSKEKINRMEPTENMGAGLLFEIDQAETNGWRRDGRPGHSDLWDGNKRVECKFFTDYIDPKTGKRVMNSAHLPEFNKSEPVLEQLARYCRKFDRLVVGHGNFWNGEYEVITMSRGEAYEWLKERLQAKGNSLELRIKWAAASTKSGGTERCRETLRKWGWII